MLTAAHVAVAIDRAVARMADQAPQTMLNAGALRSYQTGVQHLLAHPGIQHLAGQP